jgi:predicted HicB family RNase H-like nuclease
MYKYDFLKVNSVNPRLKNLIYDAARRRHISMSEYIRQAIREKLQRDFPNKEIF